MARDPDPLSVAEAEIGLSGDDEDREMSGQIVVEDEGQAAYYEVVIDDTDTDT